MPCLILLEGMATSSWNAELALRRRVSMSAIGSVIVMIVVLSLAAVSVHCDPWTYGVGMVVTSCSW